MKFFEKYSESMRLLPSIFAILTLPAMAFGADISWKETRYNPKPAAGDLVLPMPCGGGMVFRAVLTPHAVGGLNDVSFELGAETEKFGYVRGRRRAHIAGPFQTEDGFQAYYIQKYETAQAQYDVVMGEECPAKKPRKRAFVAASGLTWFDAVRFSEKYSVWLSQNAPDAVPTVAGVRGFVRLPTEVEWEYAARGGSNVDVAEFREDQYAAAKNALSEHEAFGDTSSANGKVQPIGSLEANPLGLHDMLANVSELMLEPFYLIRHQRRHGRVGGFVSRGANANSDRSKVSASTRNEVRFFDPATGAAVKDKYLGFRLVLSTIAIDSEETAMRYEKASQAAAAPDLQTEIGREEAKALQELEQSASIEDPNERRKSLLGIARSLDAVRAERNSQRDRAIENLYLATASTCAAMINQLRTINAMSGRARKSLEVIKHARNLRDKGQLDEGSLAELPRAEKKYQEILDRILRVDRWVEGYLKTYAAFIDNLRRDYGVDVTDPQEDLLSKKLSKNAPQFFDGCLGLASAHLSEARATGRLNTAEWREQIHDIAQ